MKYLRQFTLILAFSFLGELCRYLVPLPVPASIYGLLLLLAALILGWLRLDELQETADFLIAVMPLMFIPAAVGLLTIMPHLRSLWLPLLLLVLLTTLVVMAVSGWTAEFLLRRQAPQEAGACEEAGHE